MPYFERPGAELFYEQAGSDGTPVLLLMGFGMPGRMWAGQVSALKHHHRVAWLDNRGSGDTKARAGLYSTSLMANDAAALLDRLGWDQAHVVGVSMGGMIAQQLALSQRRRIRSLTLIATHSGGGTAGLPTARGLQLAALGSFGPRDRRLEAFQELIFPGQYLQEIDQARVEAALRKEYVGKASPWSRLSQLAAVARHRARPRLGELAGLPTMVVVGGRDLLIRPGETRRLHRLIPGARLVVFEEAGHGLLSQCRDALNKEILDHLRRVDEAPTERRA